MFDVHAASPPRLLQNLAGLAQRADIYTGDNFYFSFAGSNQTFLEIIGQQEPLAIKCGPLFSIYNRTIQGSRCDIYYIDIKMKALLPVLCVTATPQASIVFSRLFPWSFADFSQIGLEYPSSVKPLAAGFSPEEIISNFIEKLAEHTWPDGDHILRIVEATTAIVSREQGLTTTLCDLAVLKEQVLLKSEGPIVDNFIAPYNPLYDSVRLEIDSFLEKNPQQISVRQINDDNYQRIEVIAPGLPAEERYAAVYQQTDAILYHQLKASLTDPLLMSQLIGENFPKMVSLYFAKHALSVAESPKLK